MARAAQAVMAAMGFDDGMFNIEMMYDERDERLSIIEINPRMASQFADLYEKVDGVNTYEILVNVATGRTPRSVERVGPHRTASSCVMRTFTNARVTRVPSDEDIAAVTERYPDARIEVLCRPGRRLSEQMQDGHSYRYGVINLGGDNMRDILGAFEWCDNRLGFGLAPET
jgi:carbamoylphosphate synthase large subunit